LLQETQTDSRHVVHNEAAIGLRGRSHNNSRSRAGVTIIVMLQGPIISSAAAATDAWIVKFNNRMVSDEVMRKPDKTRLNHKRCK